MSANYAIYTSPNHQPIPDHLPTLIITPQGKPHQVLYTYLHTNYNQENYLLTPSDQGDLCVAKLFPPNKRANKNPAQPQSTADRSAIKCEASRNLKWTIRNEGIQNPVYKLTLPNPDNPQIEQPLFQVSKPNPNCPWWTLFYFTYAGHLIPPKRIEFGKIVKAQPNGPKSSGETKITVTGKTEEEKAVWRTLGEGNEDMVEWILVCAALNVLDEEISKAAEAAGVQLSARPSINRAQVQQQPMAGAAPVPPQSAGRAVVDRPLHPTGNAHRAPVTAPIRPAVYNNPSKSNNGPSPPNSNHRHPPQQQQQRGPPNPYPPAQQHRQQQHQSPQRAPAHAPPPGALPPGALPPGALPPGALPPGALPPGAFPSAMGPRPPHHTPADNSQLAYTRPPPPQQQQHPAPVPRSNHHQQQPINPNRPLPPPGSNSRTPIQVNNYPIQPPSKQLR
ncbi:hypothetical protein PSTG_06394 [Puccinia striiformis f. sp. tritici PST-78]|uniref:Uncharacterized protein n=1 Tax=Puccinia striiformis f. sp. tritici PST-78 TaxID=1165861 RepID=A0A0L0VMH3_9BASI|nr:hypothetical protein PSTG_06394 [Puccinia striiformis f. sp. tritici PST-78]